MRQICKYYLDSMVISFHFKMEVRPNTTQTKPMVQSCADTMKNALKSPYASLNTL